MNAVSWRATSDFAMDAAPGELGLVHDLMNTVSGGKPNRVDLLADLDSARAWLETSLNSLAAATKSPRVEIELLADDLDGLRALRADLRHVAAMNHDGADPHSDGPLQSATAGLQLNGDGTVVLRPRGSGARQLTSLVLSVILRAQLADTWRRVKVCRNPKCAAVFYDRSRNNSGVWHDVRVCGNAANLRASRARRQAMTKKP
ncbi:CGNR zinc finger domain-containing protein [Mycobacterium yunnanensis]|uniref:CGNR zinc finger domain-containing protein n=1 Tax=Mycobacterium yunnanensis TaxID=368477 RepID=A0A9X2YYM0_9MYCO|nr:CGNR zinc finger domain-containing protein [Mycobacterium yunnanensis]MCV7420000.1 CGNR zinc finger domain-containing protein [Mycobacterium yunnanensis]